MLAISPLSPERACARCCSWTFIVTSSAFEVADMGWHRLARHQRRPQTYHLAPALLLRHPLARVRNTRHRHAIDLAAHFGGLCAGLGAGRHAHRDLVRLDGISGRGRAVDRIQTEEVDTELLGLQLHDLEALLEDLPGPSGAAQRAGAGIKEHVLADEALGTAYAHLQRWRARLAGEPGHAHAVGADLFEPGLREIDHHIRCQVVGRVMHLVQHLLLDRLWRDAAATARDLGDHRRAIGLHLGNREGEVPGFGQFLEAGVAEVATGHLGAAFQQMADGAAGANALVVQRTRRREWSSGSQPTPCIIGARKIDGSATRPVTTICAPARKAATIGSAPRETSALIRSAASQPTPPEPNT